MQKLFPSKLQAVCLGRWYIILEEVASTQILGMELLLHLTFTKQKNLLDFEHPWNPQSTAEEKLSTSKKKNVGKSLDSTYSSSRWFLLKKNKEVTKVVTIPLSQQKGILHSELLFPSLPPLMICHSWSWLNQDISVKASPPTNFAQSQDCISAQLSYEVEKSYV